MPGEGATASPIAGSRVAVAGRLASMTRAEFAALLERLGASLAPTVTQTVNLVVIGAERWPLGREGRMSKPLLAAQQIQRSGFPIEILSEEAFFDRVGQDAAAEGAHPVCSMIELSRLLHVSGAQLRSWLRAGLIQPVEDDAALPLFDYRQVRAVQSLMGLLTAGATLRQIRRSLGQLHRWLPQVDAAADALGRLAADGARLHLTLPDGSAVEPNGQRMFEFEEDEAPSTLLLFQRRASTGDDLFRQAVECEERGDFAAAVQLYREVLEHDGPDPDVCFNLANGLHALGRHEGAVERYRQVVELDPDFPEAWCNLGNVLAQLGRSHEAKTALEMALTLDPDCYEAHYSLGDLLDELGDAVAARRHYEAYLEAESTGEWADHARARLSACGA